MKELWTSVLFYEQSYEISNYGVVKSKDRFINRVSNGKQTGFFKNGQIKTCPFFKIGLKIQNSIF